MGSRDLQIAELDTQALLGADSKYSTHSNAEVISILRFFKNISDG